MLTSTAMRGAGSKGRLLLKRGDVLGYVGSTETRIQRRRIYTGDFYPEAGKKMVEGTPVNPYPRLMRRSGRVGHLIGRSSTLHILAPCFCFCLYDGTVRLLAFSLLLISLACTSQTTKTANMEKALPAPDDRKDAHFRTRTPNRSV